MSQLLMLNQSYFHTMKFNLGDYDLGDLGLGDFSLGDLGLGDFNLGDFNLGDFDLIPDFAAIVHAGEPLGVEWLCQIL